MSHPAERTPDVLVTLADRGYLEPAKQLFSSAFHEGGWRGDYLLLAHDVPEAELVWFRDRGILVRPCEPLTRLEIGGMPAVLGSKLQVFGTEFRRWRTTVYLDADTLVRGSLESLCGLPGFHAVLDWNPTLELQIANRAELEERGVSPSIAREGWRELAAYDRSAPVFCAGFFAFDRSVLHERLFPSLVERMHRLESFSRFGDQLIVNLEFYRQWQRLSPVYHMLLWNGRPPWPLRSAHADALVMHFVGAHKPWLNEGPYRAEWMRNLARADEIDLASIPPGRALEAEQRNRISRRLSRRMAVGVAARRLWALSRRWR